MRILKVFALFALLHMAGWLAAHFYLRDRPTEVLVVVDTSYAMKPKFPAMQQWIDDFSSSSRYQRISIGTDKAMLGPLDALKSNSIIFRTAFGRMEMEHLQRYLGVAASRKILLSDGSVKPEGSGWELVTF